MKKLKSKPKPKRESKALKISNFNELSKYCDVFVKRLGAMPKIVLTSEENKKILIEWFGHVPKDHFIDLKLRGMYIYTPSEIMIL